MRISHLFLLLIFTACSSDSNKGLDNIEEIKKDFITTILTESVLDEGPFQMNYHLRAILFSDNVVSLLGEVFVSDHLPHGWIRYEGKTYIKTNGSFKEIKLVDLFPQSIQKEFLRSYCETFLKQNGDCNYFQPPDPLRDHLDQELIKVFVVDHESLILVFQPYAVGGFADGPFTVKIPFTTLIGKWQEGNPLEKHLPITKNFLSSWDSENWISDVQEDHSIAYQKETNTQNEKLLKDFGDVQLKNSDTAQFKDNLSIFANIDLVEIIISGLIGSLFGGAITLWLTNWKEKKEAKLRFKNRLMCLAYELPTNFTHAGNIQSPFRTKALEKMVYDEPLIHQDSELFKKAIDCLATAQILSTASPYHPVLKPANGQHLMRDLAEYIFTKYGIKGIN